VNYREMKLMIYSFLIACYLANVLKAQNCGFTVWGGPSGAGTKCIFPFIYNGITINSCTTIGEGDNRPWCSTKVDSRGRHDIIGGFWGYCPPNCPFDPDGSGNLRSTTPRPGQSTTPRPRPKKGTKRTTISTTQRTTTTTQSNFDLNSDSGRWLPNPELEECGYSLQSGFIIGGERAKIGEFPFMALLGYENTFNRKKEFVYKCGGSLINRRYVLTAAHCHDLEKDENTIREVVIGEYDVSKDLDCPTCGKVQRFTPEKIIQHHTFLDTRFKAVKKGDIALIRLDGLVETVLNNFDSLVMPICLPKPYYGVEEPKIREFVVAGWGKIDDNQGEAEILRKGVANEVLKKLSVPIYEKSRCYNVFEGVDETHICAGGVEGKDSCNGDSGGPLVDKVNGLTEPMTLHGIVSAGSFICAQGYPGLYTRVDHYIDWIQNNLRE